jgi:hypothetical protein
MADVWDFAAASPLGAALQPPRTEYDAHSTPSESPNLSIERASM